MSKIYLMRHGEVQNPDNIVYGDLPGFNLSPHGQEQAALVAERFLKDEITLSAIITSPLERTYQTASIIGNILSVPVVTDSRLTEWGCGPWEGRLVEDFDNLSGYYSKPMIMTGMEPHEQAAGRVMSLLVELSGNEALLPKLLVSHRETLASAVLSINQESFSKIHDLRLPMGSVWEVEVEKGKIKNAKLKWDAS